MRLFPTFGRFAFLTFLVAIAIAAPASAGTIAWLTFHSGDNTPSTAAATAGFTQAPDIGYTNLLTTAGHTVTRIVSHHEPLTPAELDNINSFDLVILGRSTNSGHYENDSETLFWNTNVTKPMINMAGYSLRANRLGWVTNSTTPPDTAGPVRLTAMVPSHPIFAGIALDGSNTMVNTYADLAISPVNSAVQRGISTTPAVSVLSGGGQVLATIATAGDPAVGGIVIAKWGPGASMTTSPVDTLGGHRLSFLSGSREVSGVTGDSAGIFDLSQDGAQLFLNAVNFMLTVPEPSAASMLFLAMAGLGLWRKR